MLGNAYPSSAVKSASPHQSVLIAALAGLSFLLIANGCGSSNTPPIPRGSVADCMKSEAAFYAIRGGWDYSRAPIVFPYHIVDAARRPDLAAGSEILVSNVLEIGLSNGTIFGHSGPVVEFGKTVPASWFVVETASKGVKKMADESDFRGALKDRGIDPPTMRSSKVVLDTFMIDGVDQFSQARLKPGSRGGETGK